MAAVEAGGAVETIVAGSGGDVVFAPPADPSAGLVVIGPTSHPKVKAFLEKMPRRVAEEGKVDGIAVGSVEAAIEAAQQGYRFINFGGLLGYGTRGLTAGVAQLRALFPAS